MGLKPKKTSGRSAAVQQQTDISRDLSLLLANTNAREQLITRLLWETGITPKELISLKKTDLNTHTNTLLLRAATTKNGVPRTISLSTQLTRQLTTHARTQPQDHLFSSRQSTQLTTRRVEQLLKEACKRARIAPITPRDLRNAYLHAAAKTVHNDEQLKTLTGLKSITKERALTEKEQERLAKELKKQPVREQALITILLETSITLNQALTLNKQDIPKLTISNDLAKLTTQLARAHQDHVFSSRQSTQLTTRRAEQLISGIGARAGLRLTSNLLRTTAQRGGRP